MENINEFEEFVEKAKELQETQETLSDIASDVINKAMSDIDFTEDWQSKGEAFISLIDIAGSRLSSIIYHKLNNQFVSHEHFKLSEQEKQELAFAGYVIYKELTKHVKAWHIALGTILFTYVSKVYNIKNKNTSGTGNIDNRQEKDREDNVSKERVNEDSEHIEEVGTEDDILDI